MIVCECMPKQEIRLKIVLCDHNHDAQEPTGHTSNPRVRGQSMEDDRLSGDLGILQLIVGPHIFELGHFGSIAPRGRWQ